MPYINQEERGEFDPFIEELIKSLRRIPQDEREGRLNYIITRLLCRGFLEVEKSSEWRYKFLCRIDGVLTNVGREIYRRISVPYEDKAIKRNGDIPEFKNI